jgi:hypothetical protein
MSFDDDTRDRPEPEPPAKCFDCGRLSVATDICIHCASPLMYSEDTIVRIALNTSGRGHKGKKRKQRR